MSIQREPTMSFLHTEADLAAGMAALVQQDPRLAPILEKTGMPALRRREGGYAGLCSIVCGQQLSTASAAAIRNRLFAAFEPFHHDTVRLARTDKLKRLGLSMPKFKSIKAIGTAIAEGKEIKYAGASGPCKFADNGNIIEVAFRTTQVKDGKLVEVKI